jgi:DNA-binding winged helix-turn-helix (wHTH) protein
MPSGGGFRFGAYQLDPHGRRLLRNDTPVPLKSRQFDLLLALVTSAGTLLTKNDLIARAWQGVIVSDDSLAQAVSRLRATPDAPELAQFIETVPRHGYRFVEPVATERERRTDASTGARHSRRSSEARSRRRARRFRVCCGHIPTKRASTSDSPTRACCTTRARAPIPRRIPRRSARR